MSKLFVFFCVHDGRLNDAIEKITLEARRIASERQVSEATVLIAESDDPIASLYPMRPYEIVLVLRTSSAGEASDLAPAVSGLVAHLGTAIHADLSSALVVEENVVSPIAAEGNRYIAIMRRKSGSTHEQYIDYYRVSHSRFGVECPGACGYRQNYVDPDLSKTVSARCGFGVHGADSVTEIFVASARAFNDATENDPIRAEATVDEERFIDRGTMAGFCVGVSARFVA